jgi:hypothetical protein
MVTGVWSKQIKEANERRGGDLNSPAMAGACLVLVAVCGIGFRLKLQMIREFGREVLWHVHGARVAVAEETVRRGAKGRGFDPSAGSGFGPRSAGWDEYMRSSAAGMHGPSGQTRWQDEWFGEDARSGRTAEENHRRAQASGFRAREEARRRAADGSSGGDDAEAEDFRALLGVGPGATKAELKRAYYQAAKRHHPDANAQANTQSFAELKVAFDRLSQRASI